MSEEHKKPGEPGYCYDWCRGFNGDWDLNDPETYEKSWFEHEKYLEMSGSDLRMEVHREYAFSLYYMTILHPDWDRDQYNRVVGMARAYALEVREPDRFKNKRWLLKQLFRVQNEVENQV